MSALDVKNLATEKLSQIDFPAPRRADFRVFFAESVHQGILRHAGENLSVEICGVLVGKWAVDSDGPYASISEFIRCDGATQKFAEVTFTHDSWAQINREMDSKYKDLRIIGWYHSHPNFGIFLSDRDGFIQQHFFSGSGQIALVVDPVRKTEGVFVWRDGKTSPLAHYWIGNEVRVGADAATQGETAAAASAADAAGATVPAPRRESLINGWMLALLGFALFQFGFFASSQLSNWQRHMVEQGAVAHYGIWKLYKPGFEEMMGGLAQSQGNLRDEITRLLALPPAADDVVAAEQKKRWREVVGSLDKNSKMMKEMVAAYGLNEQEKRIMQQLVAEKLGAKLKEEDAAAKLPTSSASPTLGTAAASPSASPSPSATAGSKPAVAPLAPSPASPAATPAVAAPVAPTPSATTPSSVKPAKTP